MLGCVMCTAGVTGSPGGRDNTALVGRKGAYEREEAYGLYWKE